MPGMELVTGAGDGPGSVNSSHMNGTFLPLISDKMITLYNLCFW